ncbi:hypothetical protein A0H81_00442 [Grifola frondosa]|uniref:Uncharacterized protein n=1 Tax=Grifola frondosa TaxID=5627 RepID=A0A1C7MU42_GRIFR|nr:hypothetical protein A0H81_00442 [Grifola frondosa]
MSGLLRPQDFELDGQLGRCTICQTSSSGKWSKMSNLQDWDEDDDWQHIHSETRPYLPSCPLSHADDDMRRALTGEVPFTAGEDFNDHFLPSLEEVLSGVGLFDAAAGPPDLDEETPEFMQEADDDPTEGVATPAPTAQEVSDTFFGNGNDTDDHFPYPNKGMMKTDILFSSSRLRFSRAQQEAVLAWGKDLGAKEVPSLYALNKFQQNALDAVGDPTVKVRAVSGNVFYMNSVCRAIAKDYAHPATRPLLHAFPEFTDDGISEVWQAAKWLVDAPDEVLTPMVRLNGKDYYINELTLCRGDRWFIPCRFFDMRGERWALGQQVHHSQTGLVVSQERDIVRCSDFQNNWPEIDSWNSGVSLFSEQSAKFAKQMPNPDRATADGLEWECPPVVVFIDDVSGNSTKQWNVHYSCYMSNGGLPRAAVEKEANIRFVATSPHASPMEIIQAVCDELKRTGTVAPFKAWDIQRQQYILIRPWILFMPGDNPMQAELCSHIGLQANFFCRCCHVGGDKVYKQSNDGYPTLMNEARKTAYS